MGRPAQGHSAGRHWNPKPGPRAISDHPGCALTWLPSHCYGAQILAPPPWVQIPALALLKASASYSLAFGIFLRNMDIVLIGLHPLQDYFSQYTQNAENGTGHGKAPDTCPPSTSSWLLLAALPAPVPPTSPPCPRPSGSKSCPPPRKQTLSTRRKPGHQAARSGLHGPRPLRPRSHTHTHTHTIFSAHSHRAVGRLWPSGKPGCEGLPLVAPEIMAAARGLFLTPQEAVGTLLLG